MASHPIVVSHRQGWLGRRSLAISCARMIARSYRDLGVWLYVLLTILLISALAFVYLAQASYVAGQIDLMIELEGRRSELHEQNAALRVSVAEYEDMSRIKSEARAMGLSEATHVEYVEVELPDPWPAMRGEMSRNSSTNGNVGAIGESPAPEVPRPLSIAWQQFQNWIIGGTVRAEQPNR